MAMICNHAGELATTMTQDPGIYHDISPGGLWNLNEGMISRFTFSHWLGNLAMDTLTQIYPELVASMYTLTPRVVACDDGNRERRMEHYEHLDQVLRETSQELLQVNDKELNLQTQSGG